MQSNFPYPHVNSVAPNATMQSYDHSQGYPESYSRINSTASSSTITSNAHSQNYPASYHRVDSTAPTITKNELTKVPAGSSAVTLKLKPVRVATYLDHNFQPHKVSPKVKDLLAHKVDEESPDLPTPTACDVCSRAITKGKKDSYCGFVLNDNYWKSHTTPHHQSRPPSQRNTTTKQTSVCTQNALHPNFTSNIPTTFHHQPNIIMSAGPVTATSLPGSPSPTLQAAPAASPPTPRRAHPNELLPHGFHPTLLQNNPLLNLILEDHKVVAASDSPIFCSTCRKRILEGGKVYECSVGRDGVVCMRRRCEGCGSAEETNPQKTDYRKGRESYCDWVQPGEGMLVILGRMLRKMVKAFLVPS
ncbi:hypothetical protein BJ508DRAFT_344868 [Ascobolus immersus RN42]|uniref:Uncharacterized protein n=1 Tax=Ascobolus immersus RN42 TaxID=1160509 RepID=A0A3N4IRZ0_ASCIM|nr:hypothetical protein BJ508DRAFT_344868 [Ascobolus immersus RN42]